MRLYLLLLTFCFGLSMAAQEVQLSWNKDLNIATELAKSDNKPILVYFSKSDCSACSQFYSNFFQRDDFKNILNDFILLMLESPDSDINNTDLSVIKQRRLVRHYNKSSIFPAVMVLNSDRQELSELYTSTDETSIVNFMNILESLK